HKVYLEDLEGSISLGALKDTAYNKTILLLSQANTSLNFMPKDGHIIRAQLFAQNWSAEDVGQIIRFNGQSGAAKITSIVSGNTVELEVLEDFSLNTFFSGGNWTLTGKTIEAQIDHGVKLNPFPQAGDLILSATTGTITVTLDDNSAIFNESDIGRIIEGEGGDLTITALEDTAYSADLMLADLDGMILTGPPQTGDEMLVILENGFFKESDVGQRINLTSATGAANIISINGSQATVVISETFTSFTPVSSGDWTLKGRVAVATVGTNFTETVLEKGNWDYPIDSTIEADSWQLEGRIATAKVVYDFKQLQEASKSGPLTILDPAESTSKSLVVLNNDSFDTIADDFSQVFTADDIDWYINATRDGYSGKATITDLIDIKAHQAAYSFDVTLDVFATLGQQTSISTPTNQWAVFDLGMIITNTNGDGVAKIVSLDQGDSNTVIVEILEEFTDGTSNLANGTIISSANLTFTAPYDFDVTLDTFATVGQQTTLSIGANEWSSFDLGMIIENTIANGSGKAQIVYLDQNDLSSVTVEILEEFKDASDINLADGASINTADWSISGRVVKAIVNREFTDTNSELTSQEVEKEDWNLLKTKDIVNVLEGDWEFDQLTDTSQDTTITLSSLAVGKSFVRLGENADNSFIFTEADIGKRIENNKSGSEGRAIITALVDLASNSAYSSSYNTDITFSLSDMNEDLREEISITRTGNWLAHDKGSIIKSKFGTGAARITSITGGVATATIIERFEELNGGVLPVGSWELLGKLVEVDVTRVFSTGDTTLNYEEWSLRSPEETGIAIVSDIGNTSALYDSTITFTNPGASGNISDLLATEGSIFEINLSTSRAQDWSSNEIGKVFVERSSSVGYDQGVAEILSISGAIATAKVITAFESGTSLAKDSWYLSQGSATADIVEDFTYAGTLKKGYWSTTNKTATVSINETFSHTNIGQGDWRLSENNTDKLVLTGNIVDINKAFNSLQYTSNPGFSGEDIISVVVYDHGSVEADLSNPINLNYESSQINTASIKVSSVETNEAPIIHNTPLSPPIVKEDHVLNLVGLSISDPDAFYSSGSDVLSSSLNLNSSFEVLITLETNAVSPNDPSLMSMINFQPLAGDDTIDGVTLMVNTGTDAVPAYVAATDNDLLLEGAEKLIMKGSIDRINAYLDTLQYRPAPGFNDLLGTDYIKITVNDLGLGIEAASGDTAQETSQNIYVSVIAVDDAPYFTQIPTSLDVYENTSYKILSPETLLPGYKLSELSSGEATYAEAGDVLGTLVHLSEPSIDIKAPFTGVFSLVRNGYINGSEIDPNRVLFEYVLKPGKKVVYSPAGVSNYELVTNSAFTDGDEVEEGFLLGTLVHSLDTGANPNILLEAPISGVFNFVDGVSVNQNYIGSSKPLFEFSFSQGFFEKADAISIDDLDLGEQFNENALLELEISTSTSWRVNLGPNSRDDINLVEEHAHISLASLTGITISDDTPPIDSAPNEFSNTVIIQGTKDAINAALDGLQYIPPKNFYGNDLLTLTVKDLGNSGLLVGLDGAEIFDPDPTGLTQVKEINITVHPINSRPEIFVASGSGVSLTELRDISYSTVEDASSSFIKSVNESFALNTITLTSA
ncbi:hypothetical protein AB751O23_BT_00010, partial [Chlamydiales bacterium SCGC AB-751-O23]